MSNHFQHYTSEIVARLINLPHKERLAWFVAIHEYLERESGAEIDSIHDFVTEVVAEEEAARRADCLRAAVQALRAGETESLTRSSSAS